MKNITQIFCDLDDFCQDFSPQWQATQLSSDTKKRRVRAACLTLSEIMCLSVLFQNSGYRTFKHFYLQHAKTHLKTAFPSLPSYTRMVELMPRALLPLTVFMHQRCEKGRGIAFVDSTSLIVCKNSRINQHKMFKNEAHFGKSSTGWYYGFKLHLVVDDCGHILSFCITPANTDDRKPLPILLKDLVGKVFGDRGYISKAWATHFSQFGIELITTIKKTMKPRFLKKIDQVLLRKRSLIETINDQLKNVFQIEHTRHRSMVNAMLNVISGLVAYSYQSKKPSLDIDFAGLVTT